MDNNRFVALDFETLSTWRASVCAVGCAVFENDKLVDKYYTVVCPPSKDQQEQEHQLQPPPFRHVVSPF